MSVVHRREHGLEAGIDFDGEGKNLRNLLIAHGDPQHQAAMGGGILLVEDEVAEAVSNPMIVIFFERLHHMRVATHDEVRACVDHLVGKFHLVARRLQSVFHAPMWAHNHQVRQGPRKADVRQRLRRVQPRHTRAIHTCRRFFGVDVYVGEEGDAQAAHTYQKRVMRRQDVLPRATV